MSIGTYLILPYRQMYCRLDANEAVRLITYELATFEREADADALAWCYEGFESPVLDATGKPSVD